MTRIRNFFSDPRHPRKSVAKNFEYRKDVGNWPEASQRLLKTDDVENLAKSELELMRNEIFARHGYCFSRKEMRQQFENESWYIPNTVDLVDSPSPPSTELGTKSRIAMVMLYHVDLDRGMVYDLKQNMKGKSVKIHSPQPGVRHRE
jgi:hypothetical protein